MTSGEVSFQLLKLLSADPTPNHVSTVDASFLPDEVSTFHEFLGGCGRKKCYLLGSGVPDDEAFIIEAGHELVFSIEDADVVVSRGTFKIFDNDWKGGEYETFVRSKLLIAARMSTPMLCVNPDMVRPGDGTKAELDIMPGTVSEWYEGMGGKVIRVGKPEAIMKGILDLCDEEENFMVGDAEATDLAFAKNSGIQGVWCWGDGINKKQVKKKGLGDWTGYAMKTFSDIKIE